MLNALAALAGLGGPWLLGRIIDAVTDAAPAPAGSTGWPCAVLVCAVAQILLSRYALAVGYRFGERTAARIREALPATGPWACPPRWSSGCRPAT